LADPTFVGTIDSSDSGAVEVGYTIFESFRRRGYAVEAVAALLQWAESTGQVSAVIACVEPRNAASRAVLDRLGAFTRIGTCSDDGTDELVFRRP
jgi:RimJ/RimL family protein N-acetyltransferase